MTVGPGVCIAIQVDLSSYEGCVKLAKDLESKERSTTIFMYKGDCRPRRTCS